ncbi:MAG TPA: sigma-70 family RNA polymerase sigma factor [Planctomycetes bacterium]|nr:sigma-70 family RNA polymerase sigma factor [Planctomycetota bacterium]
MDDASKPLEPAEREGFERLAQVVAGCQRGERTAQERLYEMFHRRVYRLMVRMVGQQDAADVTQEVFLQVFRTIAQYSGSARFETWLYRLAVNQSYQHLRRARRRRFEPLVADPAGQTRSSAMESRELVEGALARLDPELRAICLLREVDGFSYRQIAETLGIREGTVGSRLNRARRELKKRLVELGGGP